jgi:VanZ family protein
VRLIDRFLRWLPTILVMMTIFIFSSIPSQELPKFGFWDTLVKKGGHVIGYGLLALSYWFAMKWDRKRIWLAFLFSALYALSDEFHQSFVPGRHPSWLDALVIDNGGALLTLWGAWLVRKRK